MRRRYDDTGLTKPRGSGHDGEGPTRAPIGARVGLAAALGVATLMLVPSPAPAQEDSKGVGVGERSRRDFESEGLRLGSFLFFPALGITETFNDNIFATESRTRTDYITTFTPSLLIDSDWGIHSVSFLVQADINKFRRIDDEDSEDVLVEVDGRYDTFRENNIEVKAAFEKSHEPRSSPDAVDGINPTVFRSGLLDLSYFYRFTPVVRTGRREWRGLRLRRRGDARRPDQQRRPRPPESAHAGPGRLRYR